MTPEEILEIGRTGRVRPETAQRIGLPEQPVATVQYDEPVGPQRAPFLTRTKQRLGQSILGGITKSVKERSFEPFLASLGRQVESFGETGGRLRQRVQALSRPDVSSEQKRLAIEQISVPTLGFVTPTGGGKIPPKKVANVAGGKVGVNVKRYVLSQKGKDAVDDAAKAFQDELVDSKGARITFDEIKGAMKTAPVLGKAPTRNQTVKQLAALKNLESRVVAPGAKNLAETGTLVRELVEGLQVVQNFLRSSAQVTSIGGRMKVVAQEGDDEVAQGVISLIQKIQAKTSTSIDDILAASKRFDLRNADEAAQFYRTFVKPSTREIVDELRYANLLSSPLTHIVNVTSGTIQGGVFRPAIRLAQGTVDSIRSALTGKEREIYAQEVPAYYRASLSSIGNAIKAAKNVLSGKTAVFRPDLERIPTMTPITKVSHKITQAMEAADVFLRTMIAAGEKEALALRALKQGKTAEPRLVMEITEESMKTAERYLFRAPLDAANTSGQGHVLSWVDKLSTVIYNARHKIPSVGWFVPFVRTLMEIFKQTIETTPGVGLLTAPGRSAAFKSELVGKQIVGSIVAIGAAKLALDDRLTFNTPKNEREREAFYASGRQPFSVDVTGDGDWVSFAKLGPLAGPLVMVASMKWYLSENPKAATDSAQKRFSKFLAGMSEFFSEQSYLEGIGNFFDIFSGQKSLAQAVGAPVTQVIPFSSFQRWVNNIIDPIYRKTDKEEPIQGIIDQAKKSIIGMTGSLEPYTTPTGEPSIRQNRVLNAFNPARLTQSNERFEQLFQDTLAAHRITAKTSEKRKTAREKADELFQEWSQLPVDEANANLADLKRSDKETYKALISILKANKIGPEQALIKGMSNEQKAEFILQKTEGMKSSEEKNNYLNALLRQKVISKNVIKIIRQRLSEESEEE